MSAKLRITFPDHTEPMGYTINNKHAKLQEVLVPLHFVSAKGSTCALYVELIEDDGDGSRGDETTTLSEHTVMVSGKDGVVRLQTNVDDFVEPAFLSEISQKKKKIVVVDDGSEPVEEDAADDDVLDPAVAADRLLTILKT